MTKLTRELVWKVGSCMFCSNNDMGVNVIRGGNVEVRICNHCLEEAHLTKRAPDSPKAGAKSAVSRVRKSKVSRPAKSG